MREDWFWAQIGNSVGQRIRKQRKKMNLTIAALAAHIGFDRNAISAWEIGTRQPTISGIILLSDKFGVSVEYLLKGGEEQPSVSTTKKTSHTLRMPSEGSSNYGNCRLCGNILWPGTRYESIKTKICKYCHKLDVKLNRSVKQEFYKERGWYNKDRNKSKICSLNHDVTYLRKNNAVTKNDILDEREKDTAITNSLG